MHPYNSNEETTLPIYIFDSFCFNIDQFRQVVLKNKGRESDLVLWLEPLIADGVLETWIKTLEQSDLCDEIYSQTQAYHNGKTMNSIVKRLILTLAE